MAENQVLTDEQKKAKLAIDKFYKTVPDPTMLLYKLAKYAEAKPDDFKYMSSLLDKEISKLNKK